MWLGFPEKVMKIMSNLEFSKMRPENTTMSMLLEQWRFSNLSKWLLKIWPILNNSLFLFSPKTNKKEPEKLNLPGQFTSNSQI